MQLDAKSRSIRAARALKFAASDKSVTFRKPLASNRGTFTDLEDGTFRGKRLTWLQFYNLTDQAPPSDFVPDTPRRAANDNRQKKARSVPNRAAGRAKAEASLKTTADAIAAHKSRLAARMAGCGMLSTPDRIARSLVKQDPAMGKAFYRLRELMRPPLIAANDNFQNDGVEENDRNWGLEKKHDQSCMKPSPTALIAAYERGRSLGVKYFNPQQNGGRHATWIGGREGKKFIGLLINHGEGGVVYYGDKKGRRRKVRYEDGSLTQRKLEPDQANKERKLRLSGLASYMRLKFGPVLRGVLEESYLISGERSRRYSIYSPGVASYKPSDYGRLCISAMKGAGDGMTAAPRIEELAELDRADDAADFLGDVDDSTRTVIDAMINADSFSEVAGAAGMEPTSHNGKRLVLSALQKYSQKIAA
ncbi:hypothetical protein [Ochrobactrum sp. S1502_03]|uniref:hypothetical protein n=1 Tax=Ochrobactrum sp. S1502_03 TaxID=3108451 RepID=UPI0037CC7297